LLRLIVNAMHHGRSGYYWDFNMDIPIVVICFKMRSNSRRSLNDQNALHLPNISIRSTESMVIYRPFLISFKVRFFLMYLSCKNFSSISNSYSVYVPI